jgi:hypothetical protein
VSQLPDAGAVMKRLKAKNWHKWLDALGFFQHAIDHYKLQVNGFHWLSLADCEAASGFRKGDWIQLRVLTEDRSYIVGPGGQPKLTWVDVSFHVGDKVKNVRAALDIETTRGTKNE